MAILITLIYILLSVLHISLVKGSLFLVILIIIYDAIRILAVIFRIKLVVVLLSVFSIILISINYTNYYNNIMAVSSNNIKVASSINTYVDRYWVNQDNFKKLISKQTDLVKGKNSLPPVTIVTVLMVLIELSLSYMACTAKKVALNTKGFSSLYERAKDKAKAMTMASDSPVNKPIISFKVDGVSEKFEKKNGKYYIDGEEVSKSWYYESKKREE